MNKNPNFYLDIDGKQYGARLLTIGESIQVQVEVERVTNGKFTEWMKSDIPTLVGSAIMAQATATLNKAIVVWPIGEEVADLFQTANDDLIAKLWKEYNDKADSFRKPS